MKRFAIWLLCLSMTLVLAAPAAQAEDFKLGLMCPVTGKWAAEGLDMQNTVSLLVDQTNAKGGINGMKIELIVEDDAGDPRSAALAAQKLVSAGVKAVIGTYGSAVTEASQNIYDEAGVVQIATGATSIRLTEKRLPLFLRTAPRDDSQGLAAAKVLLKRGYKRIAILHDNSSYAKGLADETQKNLEGKGPEIVFFDALTPGERDYTATLTKIKATNPEVIFFSAYYPEAGMLLRQKREMGWVVDLMSADASNHADLVTIAGKEAAKGFFFVSPPMPQDIDTDLCLEFLKQYKAKFNCEPVSVWGTMAGDAYQAIEAALAAGKTEPEEMVAYLKTLRDLPVLSGTVGFDEIGDRIGDFYRLYITDADGKFILQPRD